MADGADVVGTRGQMPRGDKVPIAEVLRRKQIVRDLYVQTRSVAETKRRAKPLGLSKSTVDRYIADIREEWVASAAAEAPYRAEAHKRSLVAFAERAEAADQWSAAMSAMRLLAEIDGVRAPEKVQLEDKREDYSAWSDEDMETLHALRKRNGG